MSGKPELLFIAHRIPYPPNKGDKIRSWRVFEHLRGRFDIHLCAFVDDPADFQHQDFLQERCASLALVPLSPRLARLKSLLGLATGAPLSVAYYRDAAMAAAVRRARARPLAAEYVFSSSMAQYVARSAGRPRFIDLCDADSEKWRAYAAASRQPMRALYAREGERLRTVERAIIGWAEASFVVSAEEAALFSADISAPGRLDWFGNGVDTDYFSPQGDALKPSDAGDIVFVGAMDYRPNIDAVSWFVDKALPLVRRALPNPIFSIVGARPPPEVTKLSTRPGVRVTGAVADVRPYVQHAGVVVAPLRIARGVQNKVLEAMAMARPVVATTAAATGIEIETGRDFLRADTPLAIADAIVSLLTAPSDAAALGAQARALMVERYAWTRQLRRLDAAFDRCLSV